MILTTAQLQTIKTDIAANADLNVNPNTPDGNAAIAALYNVTASPDFWVWRTSVTKSEAVNGTSVDGTTFTWVGNGFITRSAGEQAAWRELFDAGIQGQSVDASKANVRQAFSDIFSGTGNAAANRTHLLAIARRKATRLEKLLITSGAGTTANPGVMGAEGTVTYQQIEQARNLP